MNTLEQSLKDHYIEGVIFDLDGTLIDTYAVMKKQWNINSQLMIDYLKLNYDINISFNNFLEVYKKTESEKHIRGDVSFISRFPDIAKGLCNNLNIDIDQGKFVEYFLPHIAKIYKATPEPFNNALECLHSLENIQITICTHSGEDWTKIKTDYLKKLYYEKYGKELSILIHSIELNKEKDSSEWEKAVELTGIDTNRLIVVGDSFNSDILPSIEAGFNYLVWITEQNDSKQEDINELKELGHNTEIISNIGELKELITSNRLFEDI